jgi:hypothetical protein
MMELKHGVPRCGKLDPGKATPAELRARDILQQGPMRYLPYRALAYRQPDARSRIERFFKPAMINGLWEIGDRRGRSCRAASRIEARNATCSAPPSFLRCSPHCGGRPHPTLTDSVRLVRSAFPLGVLPGDVSCGPICGCTVTAFRYLRSCCGVLRGEWADAQVLLESNKVAEGRWVSLGGSPKPLVLQHCRQFTPSCHG